MVSANRVTDNVAEDSSGQMNSVYSQPVNVSSRNKVFPSLDHNAAFEKMKQFSELDANVEAFKYGFSSYNRRGSDSH